MPRLFLIRHGETDYNLQNIVQGGGIDADLNETGRMQGRKFFESYNDIPFDRIYSTELKRTRQTIQDFENELGQTITPVAELNELNWGMLEGQPASEYIRKEFKRINHEWTNGNLHSAVEGGESPLEAWERSKKGIEKIISELPEEGVALVCLHGRIMRIVLSELLGYGGRYMNLFPHYNTALNVINFTRSGKIYAERLNDLNHLEVC